MDSGCLPEEGWFCTRALPWDTPHLFIHSHMDSCCLPEEAWLCTRALPWVMPHLFHPQPLPHCQPSAWGLVRWMGPTGDLWLLKVLECLFDIFFSVILCVRTSRSQGGEPWMTLQDGYLVVRSPHWPPLKPCLYHQPAPPSMVCACVHRPMVSQQPCPRHCRVLWETEATRGNMCSIQWTSFLPHGENWLRWGWRTEPTLK